MLTAEQRGEVAPSHLVGHSITSSARASSVGGTSRPRTLQGFVADPFGRKVRRRYKAALRGSLGFTAFSSSVAALGSHAIARTHVISNKQVNPKTLAKSTANGPKAMRNRNGFMRIVIFPQVT
jgi:hypothetical protein